MLKYIFTYSVFNDILQDETRYVFWKSVSLCNTCISFTDEKMCGFFFVGVFGSGTRVILAAISIYNYAELINN